MKKSVLRVMVALLVAVVMAGAGYVIWDLERQASHEQQLANQFESQARQLTLDLATLRADWQACLADGQNTIAWLATSAEEYKTVAARVQALRGVTRSPEALGSVESAVEAIASLEKTDARARDFLASNQRLSASDVVFSEASPQTAKAASAIDVARGHESIASATKLEQFRMQQLYMAAGAAAVTLIAVLLLVPLPRHDPDEILLAPGFRADADEPATRGLGIGRVGAAQTRAAAEPDRAIAVTPSATPDSASWISVQPPPARAVDLGATAEICAALARVQEPRELPTLLERAAAVLDAVGLVVWMPDGPGGSLRPALAHGYSPLVVTRMGNIPVDADNATATAYRTATPQSVPAEDGASAAVVAPLVTAEGCSGVMAAELRGTGDLDELRAAAAIIAAQLATLISPSAPLPARH
jgi:hypothetical protein